MPSCHLVSDLPPFDAQHNLRVVVETPRGANIKIKYDEDLGCFSLSRILPLGVTYPYDFGFVPQTLAQDGDPLDVMVLIDALTYPGGCWGRYRSKSVGCAVGPIIGWWRCP